MRPGSGEAPRHAPERADSVFGAPSESTAFGPGSRPLHTQQHQHMLPVEMTEVKEEDDDDMAALLGNLGVERDFPIPFCVHMLPVVNAAGV